MNLDEKELIKGCINGDRLAQKQLYDAFAGKMYVLSKRYAKDLTDAEDIMQEAFMKVFDNIRHFRGESPLEFWIRSIVVNTAIKFLKKQKPWTHSGDIELYQNEVSSDEISISGMNYDQLLEMIRELPEGCQTIFNLYAIEGYKHQEIAKMLDISEGTSKSQFARARMLLIQKLKAEHGLDDESFRR
jgi:RNA polymerase sigma factor (sigma-70 family)